MPALNTAFEATQTPVKKGELFMAAISGKAEEVAALLVRGADPDDSGEGGHCALLVAAVRGHTDTVGLLIGAGATLDKKNKYGYTPLISAANEGWVDVVRLLIDSLADISVENKAGFTALSLAEVNGRRLGRLGKNYRANDEVIQLLKDAPARQEEIIRERIRTARDRDMHERAAGRQEWLRMKVRSRRIAF